MDKMDIKFIYENRQMMKERAEAKHMKTKAVTGKQSKVSQKAGTKKPLGKTVTKKKAKTKVSQKAGTKKPLGKTVTKKKAKTAAKGKDAKKKSAKSVKKQSPKSASNKKAPKKNNVKKQPTKAAKDEDTKKTTPANKPDKQSKTEKVVLLLAGAGKNSDTFRNEVDQLKRLFSSDTVGIRIQNLFTVVPGQSGGMSTISLIKKAVNDVTQKMKNSQNAQFIFYYSGHFDKSHRFLVDDKEKDKFYLDEDLAKEFLKIPARYMLLMLNMCYSGSAAFGTKAHGKDDSCKESKAPVPRMWKILDSKTKARSKGPSESTSVTEKVVQWSSSLPQEQSYLLRPAKLTFFGKAIIEVLSDDKAGRKLRDDLPSGQTQVSVRRLNKHVSEHMKAALAKYKYVQRSIIMPDYANEEYFKTFPSFAQMK